MKKHPKKEVISGIISGSVPHEYVWDPPRTPKRCKNHMGASAKDPPLKLTSMLIGISLIKILVFYKIFFLNELRVKFLSSLKKKIGEKFRVGINLDRKSYVNSYVSPYFTCKY